MDKLKKYKHLRRACINDISTLVDLSEKVKTNKSMRNLFKVRCADLCDIQSEFLKQHANVCTALLSDESADLKLEETIRQEFMSSFYAVKSVYSEIFDTDTSGGTPNNSTMMVQQGFNISNTSHIRLPQIELAKFNGDFKKFACFVDQFNAMVHDNASLGAVEKFNYLLASLEGPPLSLVRTLPLTADNYLIAYNSLIERYSNERLRAQAHWAEIESSQKVTNDNPASIRKLLDIFSANLSALHLLGLPTDSWDFIVTMMLLKRLDYELVSRFEMEHRSTEIPKYSDLRIFLDKHCVALESLSVNRSAKHTMQKPRNSSSFVATNAKTNAISPSVNCSFCRKNHSLYTCTEFRNKSTSDRFSFCKNTRLCFNCLSSSHTLKFCKSQSTCKKCNSRTHHTLLHFDNIGKSTDVSKLVLTKQKVDSLEKSEGEPTPGSSIIVTTGIVDNHITLLSTAWVDVKDNRGNYQPLRALLDTGSMSTIITQKALNKLGLKKTSAQIELKGIGSIQANATSGTVLLTLKPQGEKSPLVFTDAIVLNKICDDLPTFAFSSTNWSHIESLKLADESFNKPGPIDLILGANTFAKIILPGIVPGQEGEPTAFNTIFGYVLMGKTSANCSNKFNVDSYFCQSELKSPEDDISLECAIKQLWEVESVPSIVNMNNDDKTCEEIFSKTCSRDHTGKYIVSMPFYEPHLSFPGIRDYALGRFHKLESQLIKKPEVYELYKQFMREYLDLDHMELVKPSQIPLDSYYLVHHCVIKPESTSTRLRVVFNASVKLANQKSLNDYLMTGPKLQSDIFSILLNFRAFRYAMCTDVKQMYRMIWINASQRDYQRIVWRFSPNEEIRDYRLKTVTYGLRPAPYLALRCVKQLCQDEGDQFPLAKAIILNSSYVDDFIFSVSDKEIALKTRDQLITLMSKGGFPLRKWCSNDPSLLEDLPDSHVAPSAVSLEFENSNSAIKILGLKWEPLEDYFFFNVQPRKFASCTKRSLLSELARVYDPLGFLSPITFFIKYLIQRLWVEKVDWDQEPGPEILRAWAQFSSELSRLEGLRFPRLLFAPISCIRELHCFCDASERGYACALYVRVIDSTQGIYTKLICAKSKVGSLKKITIPRLELCSMVLLTKLYTSLISSFEKIEIKFHNVFAWSDSQVALYWLNGSPNRWKTFVANRVSFIQDKLPTSHWFYVDTNSNPADLATRGLLPANFISETLWFEGPNFLRNQSLPLRSASDNFEMVTNEERKIVLFSTEVVDDNALNAILTKFSDFDTARRVLCFVRRFILKTKKCSHSFSNCISNQELVDANLLLVQFTQQLHFAEEFEKKQFSRPLRKLNAFLDENGILRVGGRLKHAKLPYDSKFPILLPRQSKLTSLIVEFYHKKYFHCGPRTTQYLISQTFWILSAKRAINSVLSKCIRCIKQNPKPFQPPMASLPPSRISQAKPFVKCGLDFGGPFFITMNRHRGIKTCKAYLCLFICFCTKAVHLELATDLSTESFLSALQRFISRRGRVSHIYCDNATNFIGANRELKLMKSAVEKENIQFVFSPPSGPHFNGLAEQGIRSVKKYLVTIIGDQILTYEEFYTVLTLIESILNSRPLIALSSDVEDINALTPGHFLTLEPLSPMPICDFSNVKINQLSRWQLLQKIHFDFWRRWEREYLHTLQQRGKWLNKEASPKVGTLVLIKEEFNPPTKWTLARIVELHPGDDGISRVATVKTAKGLLKRPLVKLCPLPTEA